MLFMLLTKRPKLAILCTGSLLSARNKLNPLDLFVAHCRNAVFNHLFPRSIQSGSFDVPFPFSLYKELKKNYAGPIANLKDTADYLGINYYTRDICEFSLRATSLFFGVRSDVDRSAVNALGWEIYPAGLFNLLSVDTKEYQKDSHGKGRPIYITENGYASNFPADLSVDAGDWSLKDKEDRHTYTSISFRSTMQLKSA